ncbi:hypothetical protein KI811_11640 [Geobacter hydrogenophilus]|uniref:Uncharacterized protein n=1 Tax=Geobacter hydrogenophilus TaxID=40983 RepID=A0A9W6G2W7_9BACT|nr:hypothetical protein [Geobacter hydrogenophilus]MBT0894461.1 hypothetical protein [Geobacter hydrogenophilus]GLI39384.1 hypothetical protein GHYDROH2_28850 [Geobacter hydrogenophilus]
MRTSMALASGFFLAGLTVAAVGAGPNAGSGNPDKKQSVQGKQTTAPTPKKAVLSKRNQAKIEVEEMKKMKQQLQTGGSN